MSREFKGYNNVIYEICNEPNNGTSWKEIKSYAKSVISTIRKNDKKAVIVVGTPTWSQDVDQAAADPIKGGQYHVCAAFLCSHTQSRSAQ